MQCKDNKSHPIYKGQKIIHQKTDDFSSDQADQPWEIAEVRRKEIPLPPPPLLQETKCRRNSGGAHAPPTTHFQPLQASFVRIAVIVALRINNVVC